MKIAVSSICLILFLVISYYAQTNPSYSVSVKSIRRVSKFQTNNKPGIEVELVTSDPKGFHIGGLYWCLQIGELKGVGEGGFPHYTKDGKPVLRNTGNNHTRLFGFTEDEWKKLKNGDSMRLSWGCRTVSDIEKIEPFAFLNKKMLKKQEDGK